MAGQIPGGADDAPDLAIAELSEETTPPLCSLRRWLWVSTTAAAAAAALTYARSLSIIVDINISTISTIWGHSRVVTKMTGKMTGDHGDR